ncbi:MAG TPA: HTTM domain-containing protein, partial [Myxococcota bacterium]|nr:HTTM domain-containing protein [Myxococcota bacterium]
FAALAKVSHDWLVEGLPLKLWLAARDELPLLGPWLGAAATAHLASWAGFFYDLSIIGWLSWRRSRPWAYGAVLLFHGCTMALFEIGMFPLIMSAVTTVFFAPGWPRHLLRRLRGLAPEAPSAPTGGPLGWLPTALLVAYAAVQIAVPLRGLLYPGNLLWHEQGMRFAWRVLVREKSGSVTYRVSSATAGRTWHVNPARYLTPRQAHEMAGQPDLVLQLAHRIARDFRSRGVTDAEVRADTRVSLNGRPPRALIDPAQDLSQVPDGLRVAPWITGDSP